MELFDNFIAKHGEHGTQAFLEMWERYRGIRHTEPMLLEHRWELFMRETSKPAIAAA